MIHGIPEGAEAQRLSAITAMTALDLPHAGEIRLDGMVLGFALVLSFATGVLFGLAPSLSASRPNLADVLKASGEESNPGPLKPGTSGIEHARRLGGWAGRALDGTADRRHTSDGDLGPPPPRPTRI